MIVFVKGNIFESGAQTLVNPINCLGTMGKGLALEFKKHFPEMYEDYRKKADIRTILPGVPYLWKASPTQIINFPTKRHWKDPSLIQDIDDGLAFLAKNYKTFEITSIAIPALGCGQGGLNWADVQPLIIKHLEPLEELDIFVYSPA